MGILSAAVTSVLCFGTMLFFYKVLGIPRGARIGAMFGFLALFMVTSLSAILAMHFWSVGAATAAMMLGWVVGMVVDLYLVHREEERRKNGRGI